MMLRQAWARRQSGARVAPTRRLLPDKKRQQAARLARRARNAHSNSGECSIRQQEARLAFRMMRHAVGAVERLAVGLTHRRAACRPQRLGLRIRGMAAGSPKEITVVEDVMSDMKTKNYSHSIVSGRHALKSAQPGLPLRLG